MALMNSFTNFPNQMTANSFEIYLLEYSFTFLLGTKGFS